MADEQDPEIVEEENTEENREEEPEIDIEEDEEDKSEDEEESEDESEDKSEDEDLARVSFSEIKTKYPQFFKDFPSLKHAFFREEQFTEVFPTIEDAKKAAEAQQQLDDMTEVVMGGDVERLLGEIKEQDPNSLESFANNFLPALENTSKELYFNILGPKVQGYIKSVFDAGAEKKDDNIKNAAKVVHKILFGGDYGDIERVTGAKVGGTNERKDSELDKDKQKFFAAKYQNLYSDVSVSCYTKLEEEIDKGLKDLAKEKGLLRILRSDIKSKVLEEMDKDSGYLGRMQSLWKREQRSGFSGQLKDSFMVTFMGKARTLIPKIRAEARQEVLGKTKSNNNGKEPSRISSGKQGKTSGKQMTMERVKKEGLTSRQVFDD